MADLTITDKGSGVASYEVRREDLQVTVSIRTDDGLRTVTLSRDEVLNIGTSQQRQAVAQWFDDAVYAAALAKAGFAE